MLGHYWFTQIMQTNTHHSVLDAIWANCKSRIINEKRQAFYFSPLTLSPFPPKGAREVVESQSLPAPFGEKCPKDRKGAASNADFWNWHYLTPNYSKASYR